MSTRTFSFLYLDGRIEARAADGRDPWHVIHYRKAEPVVQEEPEETVPLDFEFRSFRLVRVRDLPWRPAGPSGDWYVYAEVGLSDVDGVRMLLARHP